MNNKENQEETKKTSEKNQPWPLVSLGAKVKFLSGGTPRKNISAYWDGNIPWVSSGEMTQRRISDTTLHVTEEGAINGTRMVPEKTILAVVRGMSLANEFRVAITTRDLTFNQDIKAIQPKDEVDPIFLFYYLLSQNGPIRDSASESAHGTKKLDMAVLEQWPLPVPPLPVQKKITAVLSAYDDLIENNNKRIALLEKAAEEIYREWFVRLRFPGWETAVFHKGIPNGWEVVELKDIALEASVSTQPGDHLEGRHYIPLDLLVTGRMLPQDHHNFTEAKSSLVLFEEGDILFGAMRPYLHKVALAPFNGITRSTCFVIRPKDENFYSYLYLLLFQRSSVEYATLICNGVDRPYVVWKKGFERMKIFKPDINTATKFHEKINPILKFIKQNYFIERNLRQSRDMLLSRLISGKLSVDDLDIQFPPSMIPAQEPPHA